MILVDSRIGSAEYLEPLRAALNGEAKSAFLNSGDFAWEGNYRDGETVIVGLELKKLSDMLASMRSGRYAEQVEKMREEYQICYLLVVGSYAPNDDGVLCVPARGGWAPLSLSTREQRSEKTRGRNYFSYSELDKFLASVECLENTIVRKACNKHDALHQIINLHNWWQKPWDSHGSTKAVKYQSNQIFTKASTCRLIAAQLPGVGWDMAGKVERWFEGNVLRMIDATEDDWAEISWTTEKGKKNSIGPKRAAAIYQALRGAPQL